MNKTFFLPLIIVFFAFYYFLFPREGGAEIILIPDQAWTFSSDCVPDEDLLIARGEHKALFSKNGERPFLPAPRQNSVLSEQYYFFQEGRGFVLKDLEKGTQCFIEGQGYPLILNSHIFVVDLWKGRIQEFDAQGRNLWSWQGLGPITAIDAARSTIVLGLLDGSVQIFNSHGVRRVVKPVSTENDGIVYGLALSSDGSRLAVLSGLNEQKVAEYDLDSMTVLAEGRRLESRFNRPVKMVYSSDNSVLWIEQKDKVIQIGPDEVFLEILQEGRLLTLEAPEADGQLMVLSEQIRNNAAPIYIMNFYTIEGALVSSRTFFNRPEDIVLQNGQVFFSEGGRILKMKRRESL